ncbi:uncharacterized protein BX664DRAFT_388274 [Halteromyces radiatus]|uniref:uncharacterized protein n=1 Tax=Halteromyces radiatus TaxID=101107 RepID=UPI00221E4D7C|nr:uncharacterized protein BX664DRAFT_388274 [Halteromyces radiatus]KAI8083183.1 hypothetical protein BX664DRAFT_388274 [Halteromyces radiatus]
MTHISCFVTIHIEEKEKEHLQQLLQIPLEFINQQEQIATLDNERLYLVWDQPDSLLLVITSSSSTRYNIHDEKDIQLLVCQLVSLSNNLDKSFEDKPKEHALYLDLPLLKLNHNDIDRLRQAIVQCLHDRCSLTVLLDTTAIPSYSSSYSRYSTTTTTTTTTWSIQTEEQWKTWQALIGELYITQAQLTYSHHQPLFDMTVVFLPFVRRETEKAIPSTLSNIDTIFVTNQDTSLIKTWNEERQHFGYPPLTVKQMESTCESSNNDNQKGIENRTNKNEEENHRFERVIVGGTFDHLHAGHKILLTMEVLSSTKSVVVGVTDDAMLESKKYKECMESIDERIANVRQFCERIRPDLIYEVVPIYDPYGPTITDPTIELLVCSVETLKGGHMVNEERQKRHFPLVVLWVIDVISAASQEIGLDDENNDKDQWTSKISSTWIRQYLSTQGNDKKD